MEAEKVTALSLVDPSRLRDWDSILLRTREMLEAANAGDWDRVVDLEALRREEIAHFFAAGVAAYETARVRQGIQEILDSDRELLTMSQRQKGKRFAEVLHMRRYVAVQKAYEATAAG
jgi:hypothetical protein